MTQDALLDVLAEALSVGEEPEGALTVREICKKLDVNERAGRELVRELIESGQAEAIRVRRPAMDGRIMPVPAYRLVES